MVKPFPKLLPKAYLGKVNLCFPSWSPTRLVEGLGNNMKIYIAGIMQGSMKVMGIRRQNYRQVIREAIAGNYPDANILDPFSLFPDSVTFDEERAKKVLFEMTAEAGSSDVVIAYLPEASMGTAMEMIRAFDNGKTIVSISPMAENWVIRSLSSKIFPTLDDFCAWVNPTNLAALVNEHRE